ncbi:hypothetical protein C2845_PM07G18600 [Panicum miliaceum]|uniref:Uncharacterized protein n=1 Tax=Panicum miliaceum TaxID=4540 RepID=A0A3L6SRB0_PANMI|nr:hypothetical protein C2845_PM07G18600 [Panicum miliaceum]
MSRWSSSKGTIVKGRGYLDFIQRCSFKEDDVVEVWAFVERRFRLFGADLCDEPTTPPCTCSSSTNTSSNRGSTRAVVGAQCRDGLGLPWRFSRSPSQLESESDSAIPKEIGDDDTGDGDRL